jgi:hypothetical protein
MPEFDVVVENGMVVDGTGAPRFRDDIGIKEERIGKQSRHQRQGIGLGEVIGCEGLLEFGELGLGGVSSRANCKSRCKCSRMGWNALFW